MYGRLIEWWLVATRRDAYVSVGVGRIKSQKGRAHLHRRQRATLSHNVRLMESRKRSRTEDGDTSRAKKRAIKDEDDSPSPLNGAASDPDEPKDDDHLEVNAFPNRQRRVYLTVALEL